MYAMFVGTMAVIFILAAACGSDQKVRYRRAPLTAPARTTPH
jgi:hypothetical protein